VPTQNAELLTPHSSETEDEPETVPSSGSTKAEPSRPILVVGEDPSSARRWANNEIRVAPAVAPLHDPAEDRAPNTSVAAKPEDTKSQPTGEPTPLEPVIPTAPAASETSANPVKIKTAPNKAIPDIDVSSQTSSKGVGVKPLSKSGEPLKSVDDLPTADSLKTASKSGDPLYTKEVDDGLNQLLTDWTLFKKSGLFGTGKKGYEHPLFQKIKDLQIPVLLAGRFPGATQEIKQSITDYMNGWRYEQGVIYEQGETFEHYLRRVIRHILDLQK